MTEGNDMVVEGVFLCFLIIKYLLHSFTLINTFAYSLKMSSAIIKNLLHAIM